jgi:hypothetical protein
VSTPPMVQPLPTATIPSQALMPMGTTPTVVPVINSAGLSAPFGSPPVAAATSAAPAPLRTA